MDRFSHAADFGRDFGTKFEAIALQRNAFEQRGAKHLVSRGFIANVTTVEKIREPGKKLRPQKEKQSALRPIRSNAVDDIVAPALERLEKGCVVVGVILQVGILDDYVLPQGMTNTGANSGSFAPISVMQNDPHLGIVWQAEKSFPRTIGRAVINDDNLFWHGNLFYHFQNSRDPARFVVDGNDNRKITLGTGGRSWGFNESRIRLGHGCGRAHIVLASCNATQSGKRLRRGEVSDGKPHKSVSRTRPNSSDHPNRKQSQDHPFAAINGLKPQAQQSVAGQLRSRRPTDCKYLQKPGT